MDEYVKNKLKEWDLADDIPTFEEHQITERLLFELGDEEIRELFKKIGSRFYFREKLRLLKKETNRQETAGDSTLVRPSTSNSSDTRRRTYGPQDKSSKDPPPAKRRYAPTGTNSDEDELSEAKKIMETVHKKLPDTTKLASFVKKKIEGLTTDKKELVGVFGRSGVGKSSLINAMIGEKTLLPSGRIAACTSAIVKVEANVEGEDYEAEIEFISKEDWEDEVSMHKLSSTSEDEDKDATEKLSAVYGEAWKQESTKNLMSRRCLKDISRFLGSKKLLTSDSSDGLSAQLSPYTRGDLRKGPDAPRCYWPVVKCVTIKVPKNPFLRHVTLVDLPGSGDRNKSRDQMWKEVIGKCSVVWIVADMTRPVSDEDTWKMLDESCSLMGNGGECRQILFICTKSDEIGIVDESSVDVRGEIIENNMKAKREVNEEFLTHPKTQAHFSDCFEVFTVSSKEFMHKKHLTPDETEIPKLQRYLENLNDKHSETSNYISGSYGILSLIEGARSKSEAINNNVIEEVKTNLELDLDKVKQTIEEACKAFQGCLAEGVQNSKISSEKDAAELLQSHPTKSSYHTLKAVLRNGGSFKPKRKPEINLNATISSRLSSSIDKEFRKTFPNGVNYGAFNGVIGRFSMNTQSLIENHKEAKLQLLFLESEETQVKTELEKVIRTEKKLIYRSLSDTIAVAMASCYKYAAKIGKLDALSKMNEKIKQKVRDSKDTMFDQAKDTTMEMMNNLKETVLKKLEEDMRESIKVSLEETHESLPDFSVEYNKMKSLKEQLEARKGKDPAAAGAAP